MSYGTLMPETVRHFTRRCSCTRSCWIYRTHCWCLVQMTISSQIVCLSLIWHIWLPICQKYYEFSYFIVLELPKKLDVWEKHDSSFWGTGSFLEKLRISNSERVRWFKLVGWKCGPSRVITWPNCSQFRKCQIYVSNL